MSNIAYLQKYINYSIFLEFRSSGTRYSDQEAKAMGKLTSVFPYKINTFRKRVKNVVTSSGIEVGIECK